MEDRQEEAKLPQEELKKENLRVQKAAYIKQQMERQRAAEDAKLERLLREQEIIAGLRESIDDDMWQTKETGKYNREFQEQLNLQIYEAHGITEDKLTGMKEYRNALYRGAAAVLFLLSLSLTVLCGVLHGFDSNICLLMLAYTAVEGALAGKKQKALLDVVCRILYILVFPTMMVMFVCYELGYEEYGLFLPYAAILGGVVAIIGTISYFLYDPYRSEKRKLQDAKSQIRDIEKAAGKEIRRNQKIREKEEKRAQKRLRQERREQQKIEEKTGGGTEERIEERIEEGTEKRIEETGLQSIRSAAPKGGLFARFKKRREQPAEAGAVEAESAGVGPVEAVSAQGAVSESTGQEKKTEEERTEEGKTEEEKAQEES